MFLPLAAAALVGCGGGGDGETHPCDLAAFSVDVPDGTCELTDSLSVSISAYNYGPDDCPSYTATFYLSGDIFIGNSGDAAIGTSTRSGGPAAGATDAYRLTVQVPWGEGWAGRLPNARSRPPSRCAG